VCDADLVHYLRVRSCHIRYDNFGISDQLNNLSREWRRLLIGWGGDPPILLLKRPSYSV
jgi:hypothetical protein